MSRRSDEWYRGSHPPACTCVACNDRRLGRLNRPPRRQERQEGFSPRRPSSNRYRKPNWFKRILVTSILLLLAVWSGLTVLHYGKGAIFSHAVAMTGDDVRVIVSCTEDVGAIANFITRDETTPLTAGLQGDSKTSVVNEVCRGDLVSARNLSNSLREQARVASINTQSAQASIPPVTNENSERSRPRPTSTPGNSRNIGIPPSPTKVAVAIAPKPSPTPESSSGAPGFEFFKSTKEFVKSTGNSQPAIDIRELEKRVHELTNRERNQRNLASLMYDDELADIARSHSLDMAEKDYFAHDSLSGEDASDRGVKVGYDCIKTYADYYTFGLAENIYQGWLFSSTTYVNGVPINNWNSQEEIAVIAVNGWMNSQGHRENILEESYDREGIGLAIAEDGKVYVTANFC